MRSYKPKHLFRLAFSISCFILLVAQLSACDLPWSSQPQPKPTTPPVNQLQCAEHSSNPVTLTMYYGSEKQAWIDGVVPDFNSRKMTACDGPITVKTIPIGSGDSMNQILDGKIQPDIWSPAGSVWYKLLDTMWLQKYGSHITYFTGANDAPSLVNSPVVIAMWKSEAQALGWPNQPIGWAQIAQLSTGGWAALGHPELTSRFGDFKFGHTRPDLSNSGLDAVIAENYAGSNEQRTLTLDDVNNSQNKDFVANVESSIIYYGDNSNNNSTGFFASTMFCKGPGYLSAAVLYESLIVEGNEGQITDKGRPCQLQEPVVAIYPSEGTFMSDHPFVIPQASWVTPAKKAAAQVFRDFLLAAPQQQKALEYGFRPGNPSIVPGTPIDSAHGVDPHQPQASLIVPSGDVVQAVITSWLNQRRKVDVMLILDHSGSMNDNGKIGAAKQGLVEFVNQLGDLDGLGLTIFNNSIDVLSPVMPLGPNRQKILAQINTITACCNTRLYDAIDQQVTALKTYVLDKSTLYSNDRHIKVVVVLTDGMDDASALSINQLIKDIAATGSNAGEGIKVFTIAYGSDADVGVLQQIANATGGEEYPGTPQNIQQVYLQISQFF